MATMHEPSKRLSVWRRFCDRAMASWKCEIFRLVSFGKCVAKFVHHHTYFILSLDDIDQDKTYLDTDYAQPPKNYIAIQNMVIASRRLQFRVCFDIQEYSRILASNQQKSLYPHCAVLPHTYIRNLSLLSRKPKRGITQETKPNWRIRHVFRANAAISHALDFFILTLKLSSPRLTITNEHAFRLLLVYAAHDACAHDFVAAYI